MKPRIRPKRRYTLNSTWFECQGVIPGTNLEGWGYGITISEAYENWLEEPIPF